MVQNYLDANKEPLVQGGVYVLGERFYVLDHPLPSQPNQPIIAKDDNGSREEIRPSAVSHMFRLDRLQMRVAMNVLRTRVNFLERQLAQPSLMPKEPPYFEEPFEERGRAITPAIERRATFKDDWPYLDGKPLPCGMHFNAWNNFFEIYKQERAQYEQSQPSCTRQKQRVFNVGCSPLNPQT